jgi:hypothetical protein
MKLSPQQLKHFEDEGYLFFPNCFSEEEVAVLRAEAEQIYRSDRFAPIEPVADDALMAYARAHKIAAE